MLRAYFKFEDLLIINVRNFSRRDIFSEVEKNTRVR